MGHWGSGRRSRRSFRTGGTPLLGPQERQRAQLPAAKQRRYRHQPITTMQLRPVRFVVSPKSQAAQRPFAHTLVIRETGFTTSGEKSASIQDLNAALAADRKRIHLILDDVIGGTSRRSYRKSHATSCAPGRYERLSEARGETAARDHRRRGGASRYRHRPLYRRRLRRRVA